MYEVSNRFQLIQHTRNPLIMNTPCIRELIYWGSIYIVRGLGVFSIWGKGLPGDSYLEVTGSVKEELGFPLKSPFWLI